MLHKTTSQGLEKYTYSNSEIYFQSDGLLKKTTIIRSVYDSKFGQAIYNFKATIVWSKLRIQASTQLVSPKNRLLTLSDTNTAGQLTASSEEVCIFVQGEGLCPTCAAICNANNGDAPPICGICPFTTGTQILFLAFFSFFLMF